MARPVLMLIGGLPGSGKSTLAAKLGAVLGWTVLLTDEIRKDRAGADARSRSPYPELLRRARAILRRGESVILDATWVSESRRRSARELASAGRVQLVEMMCVAPLDVLQRRLIQRTPSSSFGSEAGVEVLEEMRMDPWPEATVIDTSRRI